MRIEYDFDRTELEAFYNDWMIAALHVLWASDQPLSSSKELSSMPSSRLRTIISEGYEPFSNVKFWFGLDHAYSIG
jgi:hypothetical protein